MKRILDIRRNFQPHWVGDGFPVRSVFSYHEQAEVHDPFLLLDYAEPFQFPPGAAPRGVGEHPHRGFETVTILYQGELEHRDSAGNQGTIGPGDVQWMTAAAGVVHEEFHSHAFTKSGGSFEVAQLWVNLPAENKMSPPRYQEIRDRDIPRVQLSNGAGTARVIAGDFAATRGPARTVTPIVLCDLQFTAGHTTELVVPDGYTTMLVVEQGSLIVNDAEPVHGVELAVFDRAGDRIAIDCRQDARALLLCGKPIGEPVVGQGPFVMTTREEIRQAMLDYQSGRMGSLSTASG
jgi:redox-sensitive bicupin YhaK (pirin superfamily)